MDEQFDIYKRLMAMQRNAVRLEQQENTIAKQSSKLHSNLASLAATIEKQQRDFEKLNALVNQRREDQQKRIALIKSINDKIAEEKQRNVDLQAQLAKVKEERSELMGSVRALSDATNTYINPNSLPARVSGVTVIREEGRWIPFDLEAHDLSTLYTLMQKNTGNDVKWRQLLSMENPSMPTSSDKENANGSMAMSIIEIDLTSPPSHRV